MENYILLEGPDGEEATMLFESLPALIGYLIEQILKQEIQVHQMMMFRIERNEDTKEG